MVLGVRPPLELLQMSDGHWHRPLAKLRFE